MKNWLPYMFRTQTREAFACKISAQLHPFQNYKSREGEMANVPNHVPKLGIPTVSYSEDKLACSRL